MRSQSCFSFQSVMLPIPVTRHLPLGTGSAAGAPSGGRSRRPFGPELLNLAEVQSPETICEINASIKKRNGIPKGPRHPQRCGRRRPDVGGGATPMWAAGRPRCGRRRRDICTENKSAALLPSSRARTHRPGVPSSLSLPARPPARPRDIRPSHPPL